MVNRKYNSLAIRECSNVALHLYRYFDGRPNEDVGSHSRPWHELALALNAKLQAPHIVGLHREMQARQKNVLESLGESFSVIDESHTTQWRLAIGLSYGRLWDIGFQLHPLTGLPYIPASSFKGALCHCALEEDKEEKAAREIIFGATDKEGAATFFDVFAEPKPGLFAEDIINQHNQKYYSTAAEPPADDTDPNPVKFLTISPRTTFHFTAVLPKEHDAEGQLLRKWFKTCVTEYGFGAKTRKGYGLFQ